MSGNDADGFRMVGAGYRTHRPKAAGRTPWLRLKGKPLAAVAVFSGIAFCCLFAEWISGNDPGQFHLSNLNQPPGPEFYFGTDSLGRDIYSVLWHGGRASILVGLLSALVMTAIGIVYGCLGGMASGRIGDVMMRAAELAQSVPVLLTVLLVVSLTGRQDMVSISVVIGVTGWFGLARLVRSEVRQIRNNDYVVAARCMGAGFMHLARRHLIPNFVSAILFAVVSSVGAGMALESTLSFLGLGLPVDVPSWGGMLSLADRALLTNAWWAVVIPGLFLVVTLLCINSVGNYFRKENNARSSNL